LKKKILFITGTRADFGKIQSVIKILSKRFNIQVIITGMHILKKYGSTYKHVIKNLKNIKYFKCTNQSYDSSLDLVVSNSIRLFSPIIKSIKPDLIIIHGDRAEALAGAISGSFNNYLVGHIEGGELSGTIDEHIRHAISKLSHVHFVSNLQAKNRLLRMGENLNSVHVVGSPDLDVMNEEKLPPMNEVKKRYGIYFDNYSISILHPVTTDLKNFYNNSKEYFEALIKSNLNYVVILPNNDPGSYIVHNMIEKLLVKNNKFKILPSMRFEYFLRALQNSMFIIGNSSSGIKEAPFFGVPSINVGTRQFGRASLESISNVQFKKKNILSIIKKNKNKKFKKDLFFGKGDSSKKILKVLSNNIFWNMSVQKIFSKY